jgi:hypothetical protein
LQIRAIQSIIVESGWFITDERFISVQ